jgi:hypothetical protein
MVRLTLFNGLRIHLNPKVGLLFFIRLFLPINLPASTLHIHKIECHSRELTMVLYRHSTSPFSGLHQPNRHLLETTLLSL